MKNLNIFVDVDLTLVDEREVIMPGTCLNPFVFDVNEEESWEKMAEKILDNYVA